MQTAALVRDAEIEQSPYKVLARVSLDNATTQTNFGAGGAGGSSGEILNLEATARRGGVCMLVACMQTYLGAAVRLETWSVESLRCVWSGGTLELG